MTTLEQLAKTAYEKMLERVNLGFPRDYRPQWETEPQILRDNWLASIRAVMEELKKPTDDMTMIGMRRTAIVFGSAGRIQCEMTFVSMIDAILGEGKS